MRIKKVTLKTFKRFSDLTLTGIPDSARLVVLVGPNGAGKSSLFEAFNWLLSASKGSFATEADYYIKALAPLPATVHWPEIGNRVNVELHDGTSIGGQSFGGKKAFYVRSSYRHEADFSVNQLTKRPAIIDDPDRPQKLISNDKRVAENYQRIVADTVAQVFGPGVSDDLTRKQIRERLIGEIRQSLANIFPDLDLEGPGHPLEDGGFFFNKGGARNWRYKNLSGGEKAAFDLILDFLVKRETFDDTVYCIDEPELHMHSKLQASLLGEIFLKLPEQCQLWVATHSIGMIRKARDLAAAHPNEVVFLDFDGWDFDQQVEISPAVTTRAFWKLTFSVAIGDLAELVAPRHVVCCEGAANRSGEFDAKCFRQIFELEFPDVEFVSLGGASEVERNAILVASVFRAVLPNARITSVVDRDDRSSSEIAELSKKATKVLSVRHLENYLFSDEILEKLCRVKDMPEKIADIASAKSQALSDSVARGHPTDDYKSMSGFLYNAVKKALALTQCGNNSEAFCVQTLAPLITPETHTYQQLKSDVFD